MAVPPEEGLSTQKTDENTSVSASSASIGGNVSSIHRLVTTLEHHEADCYDEIVAARDVSIDPDARRMRIGGVRLRP